jgi:xylan 1,4-beta-xylosidase
MFVRYLIIKTLQYIGFHAKGAHELVNGNIRINMGTQLNSIKRAFEFVSTLNNVLSETTCI